MTWREQRRPYGASWASDPTSTPGMFALERVLRAQDRIREILPFAERFADLEPNASGPRLLELRVYTELDDKSELEVAAEDWMDSAGSPPSPIGR